MNKKKIKILHIINSLSIGGAERMLFNIISSSNISEFDISVFSLKAKCESSVEIEKLGIPVLYFNVLKKQDFIFRFLKILLEIVKLKPDLVQTWLYQSNLIGGIATKIVSSSKIVWSLHSTLLKSNVTKKSTKIIVRLSSMLSKYIPDKIICCSNSSYSAHKKIGFDTNKMIVIPNGINLSEFNYSNSKKSFLLNKLNIDDDKVKVIGMVGRYHKMKRHDIFFHAAKIISDEHPFLHFLICGNRINSTNDELMAEIKIFEINSKIHLLDNYYDMSELYSSLNLLVVTSSFGEAFPLTICEAMACKIPVISTDVGDCAQIIGDMDMVVPINDPILLAEKIEKVICLDKKNISKIGEKNRIRIKRLFEIKDISKRYENQYQKLLNIN